MHGNTYRIVPTLNGRQAAAFWKFWTAGDEAYASSRKLGHLAKISVHKSGQIHFRLGDQKRQTLSRPLVLGQWLHAFELRFLRSPGAFFPPAESLTKRKAHTIEITEDVVLCLNLLVGTFAGQKTTSLPPQFFGAEVVWQTPLRNRRPVVLIARILKMDDANRERVRYIREELKPRANFTAELQSPPYVEVRHAFWHPTGGNVILVIPMGKEGYHVETATPPQGGT